MAGVERQRDGIRARRTPGAHLAARGVDVHERAVASTEHVDIIAVGGDGHRTPPTAIAAPSRRPLARSTRVTVPAAASATQAVSPLTAAADGTPPTPTGGPASRRARASMRASVPPPAAATTTQPPSGGEVDRPGADAQLDRGSAARLDRPHHALGGAQHPHRPGRDGHVGRVGADRDRRERAPRAALHRDHLGARAVEHPQAARRRRPAARASRPAAAGPARVPTPASSAHTDADAGAATHSASAVRTRLAGAPPTANARALPRSSEDSASAITTAPDTSASAPAATASPSRRRDRVTRIPCHQCNESPTALATRDRVAPCVDWA